MIGYSLCSGIGAPEVSAPWIDWRFGAEIAPFPRAVMSDRHPSVRLWGDFTALRVRHLRRLGLPMPDVIVAGTPCQDFSIAGNRAGLDGRRGNLSLEFVRIADAIDNAACHTGDRGPWLVWENVPGVLSDRSNAFGAVLGAMVGSNAPLVPGHRQKWTRAGLVAGPRRTVAWRVLDAQYFGLAQRRERVFVVSCPAGRGDPSAVLFEPEGVRRHSPPCRDATQDIAGTLATGARSRGGWRLGADEAAVGHCVVGTLKSNGAGADDNDARDGRLVTAYRTSGNCGAYETSDRIDASEDGTGRGTPIVPSLSGVRRLTPTEAERLQGFPDNFTAIPWRGKPADQCPDGPRYMAIGNSMAVPVIGWILRRMSEVDDTGKRRILGS